MKLLLCTNCHDVIKPLDNGELRSCKCGKTSGRYLENGCDIEYSGPCKVLGFSNSTLASALQMPPRKDGLGNRFVAFVIPDNCPTIKRVEQWLG